MKKKILVLAKTLPLHDRASGDYRLFQILDLLGKAFEVHFLSTTHTTICRKSGKVEYLVRDSAFSQKKLELLDQKYIDDLNNIGVRTLNQAQPKALTLRPRPEFDIRPYLEAEHYDFVWVEFFYLADQYIEDIRRLQPWAKVICDSVDLHFRRLARQCNFMESQVRYLVNWKQERKRTGTKSHRARLAEQRRHADHVRENELRIYGKCDAVVVVSEDDRTELARHAPNLPLLFVPNIHRPSPVLQSATPGFAERSGCVFVGNFDHSPNVSSALFLKHEVAPLIQDQEINFFIVGSNPPKIVRTLGELGPEREHFWVTGYVPDTLPYLNRARVSVAPILFGAGMNGKIGEALAAGIPVVTTWLGAQGMNLVHEETCLVADDPQSFAACVDRLHSDQALWDKLQKNARAHVQKLYSHEELAQSIIGGISALAPGKIVAPAPRSIRRKRTPSFQLPQAAFPRPVRNPDYSVIILTHNKWRFTELCLRSLAYAEANHPELSVEYLLVDNASHDGTPDFAEKIRNLKVLRQPENLGFAAGNNIGLAAARGKNLILLNNDTVVPPDWIARLDHFVQNVPNLGILGPSTNTETGQALPGARYNSVGEFFSWNERISDEQPGAWERVQKISGLCLLLTREALEKVGPLDADFGIGYFEDDDLCLRAEDAGLTVAWAKDVYVHHFGSISFADHAKGRTKILEEGMAHFAFKWGKRGLEHIAKAHQETLLRLRQPKSVNF